MAVKAAITGVEASLPEYILGNEELSRMIDTSDDWIMSRIGIKERRILKGQDTGISTIASDAVNKLLKKTNTSPAEIDLVICATVTPDMMVPATANIISDVCGIKNAFSFDLNAGCSGFLYALTTGAKYVESGFSKKAIIIGADKMSAIIDYTDRATCCLFGDGAGAVLLEPVTDDTGIIDSILRSDGSGHQYLYQKAGGSLRPASHQTVDNHEHFVYQDGQVVFKRAVVCMADITIEIMNKHNMLPRDLAWFVPHQANMRIINATARRMGISRNQIMINIEKYGNTTAATLPLCLWEWEPKLKKGDNIILATFGAGFTWGAIYLKWAYNSNNLH